MGVRVITSLWSSKDEEKETNHDWAEATEWGIRGVGDSSYLDIIVDDENDPSGPRILATYASFARVEAYDSEDDSEE